MPRQSLILAGSIAALLLGQSAHAATYYWDLNGDTANTGTSATGNWNGSFVGWNTASGGGAGTNASATSSADDLIFSSGTGYTAGGTITLSGTRAASSITFEENAPYTLSGGTSLTIGGTGAAAFDGIRVLTGNNAANSISTALILAAGTNTINTAGTGVLTISGGITGAQALILDNDSTNAAGITISGASLNNGGNVTNSGGGAGGVLISSVIGTNVTSVIQNSATSALTLSGANLYTGATTITAGVLRATTSTAFGTVAGGVSVASAGALELDGSGGALTIGAEALSLNGTGIGNGGALRNFSGDNSWAGTITLADVTGVHRINSDSGTLTIGAGGITETGTNDNKNLTFGGAGNVTVTGNITETSVGGIDMLLTKDGAGTLTLSGTNNYEGGTTVSLGILSISDDDNLGATTGGLTISNGATLQATTNVVTTTRAITLGTGGAKVVASSALYLGGAITGGTGINFDGEVILNRPSGNNAIGAIVVNSQRLHVQNALTNINGSTVLVKNGASLNFQIPQTTLSNAVTFESGAGLSNRVGGGGTLTVSNATLPTAGTMIFNSDDVRTNAIIVSAATTLTGDLTFQVGGSNTSVGTVTLGGVVSGSLMGIAKTSTGTLILGGANTYTGATTVSGGTLKAGVAAVANTSGAFGNNSAVTMADVLGATLDITGFNTQIGSLTGGGATGGNVILGAATLTVGGDNTSPGTYAGVISGTGGLTKIGSGTLALSGANTFTSGLSIKAGTVTGTVSTRAFGATNSVITIGDTTGSADATLNAGLASTFVNPIIVAGGNTGTATITDSANATFSGAITLNNHALQVLGGASNLALSNGGITGTGALTINANGAGVVTIGTGAVNNIGSITNSGSSSGTTTISGIIGTRVTKVIQNSTSSELILSGANTFTSGLSIKAGTVTGITSTLAFGAVSNVITIGDSTGSANTTLNAGLASTFVNAITVTSGNTGTATITDSANATFSGAITLGNHALQVLGGANTLALTGGITGTGALMVNANDAGAISIGAGTVNMLGTIANSGVGSGTTTISGAVGSNVTAITENSTTSALTVSGLITVNSGGTTLTNAAGTKLLTVSGGVGGTGALIINNNSATAGGVTIGTGSVNNTGSVTSSGTGAGSVIISSVIGTNVTGLTQNGASNSTLVLTGANTYTGVTTVSGGTLQLNRSTADNSAIRTDNNVATTSDILINGGTLQILASEQIGNTGSISLTSGAFNFGSSSGLTETIDKLTVSGGTFSTGANTLDVLGATVTWSGGTNTISSGGSVRDKHWVVTGGTNTVNAGGTLEVRTGGGTTGMYFGGTGTPTITLDSSSSTAGQILLNQDVTVDNTLTSGTAQILSGGSGTNAGFIDLQGGTRIFTINNGSNATDMLISAKITNGALTKGGAGTLKLTGSNTFTGATLISQGTLEAGAAGALGATTSVTVSSGGTLLLSGAGAINRVKDTALITLGGGTLSMAGLSGASETLGGLTLSADSIIDFGTGNSDTLHFASLALNGHNLTINHWTGSLYYPSDTTDNGDPLQDRLLFDTLSLSPAQLADISFFSDAGTFLGTGLDVSFGTPHELVPVPEPTTVIGGLLLVGLIGYRERRRLGGVFGRFIGRQSV